MPNDNDAPDASTRSAEEIRDVLRHVGVPQRVLDLVPPEANGLIALHVIVVRIPCEGHDAMMVLPMIHEDITEPYLAAVAGQMLAMLAKRSPDGFEATLDRLNQLAMAAREMV